MKYLHKYETIQEFNDAYNGDAYEEPWVSYTVEDGKVEYNKLSNWIRVTYAPNTCAGSGYGINREPEYDADFDNSENSTYILYDECNEVERTVKGVEPYWNHYCNLSLGEPEDHDHYYAIDNVGGVGGDWIIRWFEWET